MSVDRQTKVIYRITYPNGKIYVGVDLTGTLAYFGSPNPGLIAADFTDDERRDFTIRKETLWESGGNTDNEVRTKEVEFILALKSNDPAIGYNRWPRFRTQLTLPFAMVRPGPDLLDPNPS